MRGRKPIPIPIQRARGNPGKRRPKHEPQIRHLRPDIPDWIGKAEQRYLNRLVPALEQAGVLTVVDGEPLAVLASLYAEIVSWRQIITKAGIKRASEEGWIRELRRAEDNYRKMLTEYGLTPVSRTRLATKDEPPSGESEDDLDAV